MSFARSIGRRKARLAALGGLLALPLLAGCVYDDGYYDSGYGYGDAYGGYAYGGYGYGYPYGYGYYGSPCWPYGCDDWHHRRHHHGGWDDGDGGGHHHHGGGDVPGGGPGGNPGGGSAGGGPGGTPPSQPTILNWHNKPRMTQSQQGNPIWVPQKRDSAN